MSAALDGSWVALGGGAAAAACLAVRAAGCTGAGRFIGGVGAAAALVASVSGHVALLALTWGAATVAVSARDRPTDLRTALAALGDAVAVASLVAWGLDSGTGRLPWAGDPSVADWAPLLFGAGLATRALAVGLLAEPGLAILGFTVALRFSGAAAGGDATALVAAAPLAALLAWARTPADAVGLLGVGLLGVGDPAAAAGAAALFAGAGLVGAGTVFATRAEAAAETGAGDLLARVRAALDQGAPGGLTAGALALAAVLPATALIVQVPFGRQPEAAVVVAAALAVLAAAGAAAGARRIRPDRGARHVVAAVLAAVLLGSAFVAPGIYSEALADAGARAGSAGDVLGRVRGGLLEAAAFGVGVAALMHLGARVRASR